MACKWILYASFQLILTSVIAQKISFQFVDKMGQCVDREFVYNKTNNKYAWADTNGIAEISVSKNDTIIFRHVSYMRMQFIVPDKFETKQFRIILNVKTYELKEVTLDMRQRIRNALAKNSQSQSYEMKNLNKNVAYINRQCVKEARNTPIERPDTHLKEIPTVNILGLIGYLMPKNKK